MATGDEGLRAPFDPGVRCLFNRFDNCWKSGVAHLDEVEQISINDIASCREPAEDRGLRRRSFEHGRLVVDTPHFAKPGATDRRIGFPGSRTP